LEKIFTSVDRNTKEAGSGIISQEWVDQWIEGAKRASDNDVRNIWARILASATASDNHPISLKLLETLRFVDPRMAKLFNQVAPQMYFTRFYSSLDPQWLLGLLLDAGLVSRLGPGTHTISLQSAVVQIDFTPGVIVRAYRLTRMGSELFEALHPDARPLLLYMNERDRKRPFPQREKDHFKDYLHVINDKDYNRLGEQLAFLIRSMFIPKLLIGVRHLGEGETTKFAVETDDYCVAWESTFHQTFAMTREEDGRGPIKIHGDSALQMSLCGVTTATDRKVIRKLFSAIRKEEKFERAPDGTLHRVIELSAMESQKVPRRKRREEMS
jgi:hypothetical protein